MWKCNGKRVQGVLVFLSPLLLFGVFPMTSRLLITLCLIRVCIECVCVCLAKFINYAPSGQRDFNGSGAIAEYGILSSASRCLQSALDHICAQRTSRLFAAKFTGSVMHPSHQKPRRERPVNSDYAFPPAKKWLH